MTLIDLSGDFNGFNTLLGPNTLKELWVIHLLVHIRRTYFTGILDRTPRRETVRIRTPTLEYRHPNWKVPVVIWCV